MDLCLLDHAGETLVHRHMPATPEALRTAIAPSRGPMVLAAACLCTWSWLADRCTEHAIPCVLGHARSLKALHGGQANNDTLDAQTIAVLLRGGMLPQAAVSPAAMRATRDRLRRRRPLTRTRAALLTHVHKTNSPDTLPAISTKMADQANREGVAARCAAPAGHQSLAGALALLPSDDAWLRDGALRLVTTAKHHDATPLSLRHTVPGIGTMLRLVWRDDLHDRARFPRGQDVASDCRLLPCARASAGTRSGTSGATIGNAHRTWALSAAAV